LSSDRLWLRRVGLADDRRLVPVDGDFVGWRGNRRFSVFATGSDSPRGPAFGPDGYLYSKVLLPAVAIGLLRG
jgi:hypothetical protein